MADAYTPRLAHKGVSCFDIEKMIDFYTAVFNLQLTDRGVGVTFPFPLAFMSARPDQRHQLALAQNRPAGAPSTIMQISFKVDTLAELREARRRALEKGATKMRGVNHANAISIYCLDPKENTLEVYLDTPWYVKQPHGDSIDLAKLDAEIWAETERIASRPHLCASSQMGRTLRGTPAHVMTRTE